MANIFIVDDDAGSELLMDSFTFRGHSARRARSVQEALDNIDSILNCDLVVLDLVMPHEVKSLSLADGQRSSGMIVYLKLREASKSLPILVFTANQDVAIIDCINSDRAARYVPRWSSPSLGDFMSLVSEMLGVAVERTPFQTFIVHGHDEAAKLALKNYLQNTLRLPEPIILHEKPNQGRTIIEKFEDWASAADLIFVLLTPDDLGASGADSDSAKRRARQNVIFEMGYFLGELGRHSGRVFLLYKGELELPSDIGGLIYLNIDSGIEAISEQIRREIEALRT
jgi:CheY-like chemotaxis protein